MLAVMTNPPDNDTDYAAGRPDREFRLRHLAKELHNRSLRKGITQADLCRLTKLGRDSMSRYFRGMTLPDPLSLAALARALDTTPKELDPGINETLLTPGATSLGPRFEMRQDPNDPGTVTLRINQQMPFGLAAKIVVLLEEHDRQPKG